MKKNIKSILSFGICYIITILLVLSLEVWKKPIPEAKLEQNIVNEKGEELAAVCITDLKELQTLPYVNYTPNEFIHTSDLTGKAIKIDKNTKFASRGTLKFIILNINPNADDFYEKSDKLKPYLEGDNQWHFGFWLPNCFSSANIYVKSVLSNKIGEIKNYDFIEYCDYAEITNKHKTKTSSLLLDLNFYTRRQSMTEDLKSRAFIITIHYEAKEEYLSGISEIPMIGSIKAVKNLKNSQQTFTIVISLIAIIITAILAFTSLLNKDLSQLPQIIITLCISCYIFTNLLLMTSTTIPYLLLFFEALSLSIISLIFLLTTHLKIKQFSFRTVFIIFALIYTFMFSFCSISKLDITSIFTLVLKISSIPLGLTTAYIGYEKSFHEKKLEEGMTCCIISVLAIALPFMDINKLILTSSITWLLILILCITTYSAFTFFIKLEMQNKYLTNNLQNEVAAQTKDLKHIIEEREYLLRYLSHDMKKPVSSIQRFLQDLKADENKDNKIKKIEIIEQKVKDIELNLVDLQKFAKESYTMEESKRIDVASIIQHTYETLSPDCEANNVILTYSAKSIYAYVKQNTLYSVLNNLVFNALEHSECKEIKITSSKEKEFAKIQVIDDGVGIQDKEGIFKPYHTSEHEKDNLGLGLYICNQHIISMGGTLEVKRKKNKTIFVIKLPIA